MAMPGNPFATETAARVYAAGRPDYSGRVTEIVRGLLGDSPPLRRAVDVGCGTGISSRALAPLADEVIGVEASAAMLGLAMTTPNVTYRLGSAEDLPVDDDSCDLIGVGSAIHWFDLARFLQEASRVATTGAWLVVHDHWFAAEIQGADDFSRWCRETYLSRFPPPPRDRSWRPPEHLGAWRHVAWERYDHPIALGPVELANYLLTQSNVQTAITRGEMSERDLRRWLLNETSRFFPGGGASTFLFGGYVVCHREDA